MRSIHRAFLVTLVLGVGAPLVAQQPAPSRSTPSPHVFGTSVINYVEIPAVEFLPYDSTVAYTSNGGTRYSTTCSGACLMAPLHLPSGAKLVYIELDFIDSDPDHWVEATLNKCNFAGQNCSPHPTSGSTADCTGLFFGLCSGMAFAGGQGFVPGDLEPDNLTIDNFHESYYLQAGGTSTGGQTRIGGMIVGYVLQVSPAPATATFTDVPTNHPYFQFIEALAAAGITSGCNVSPPQYCPDRQITRGEMAVYIAKALGLEFQ